MLFATPTWPALAAASATDTSPFSQRLRSAPVEPDLTKHQAASAKFNFVNRIRASPSQWLGCSLSAFLCSPSCANTSAARPPSPTDNARERASAPHESPSGIRLASRYNRV